MFSHFHFSDVLSLSKNQCIVDQGSDRQGVEYYIYLNCCTLITENIIARKILVNMRLNQYFTQLFRNQVTTPIFSPSSNGSNILSHYDSYIATRCLSSNTRRLSSAIASLSSAITRFSTGTRLESSTFLAIINMRGKMPKFWLLKGEMGKELASSWCNLSLEEPSKLQEPTCKLHQFC